MAHQHQGPKLVEQLLVRWARCGTRCAEQDAGDAAAILGIGRRGVAGERFDDGRVYGLLVAVDPPHRALANPSRPQRSQSGSGQRSRAGGTPDQAVQAVDVAWVGDAEDDLGDHREGEI